MESALAQTVSDLEIIIVGDGATDETAITARELESHDSRVRFVEFPKGEHHGEHHRHRVVSEAKAPIVCYLSDDDLWFPEHVAYLEEMLAEHDFAHSLGVRVSPDGSVHTYPGNLADASWRDFVLTKGNFIPLHAAGHTKAIYRQLSVGWSPPPEGVWSDLHMWRRLLSVPGSRSVTGLRPTSLHLTSNRRRDADLATRMTELESWALRLRTESGRAAVRAEILDAVSGSVWPQPFALERSSSKQWEAKVQALESVLRAAEREGSASRRRRLADGSHARSNSCQPHLAAASPAADDAPVRGAHTKGWYGSISSRRRLSDWASASRSDNTVGSDGQSISRSGSE